MFCSLSESTSQKLYSRYLVRLGQSNRKGHVAIIRRPKISFTKSIAILLRAFHKHLRLVQPLSLNKNFNRVTDFVCSELRLYRVEKFWKIKIEAFSFFLRI